MSTTAHNMTSIMSPINLDSIIPLSTTNNQNRNSKILDTHRPSKLR